MKNIYTKSKSLIAKNKWWTSLVVVILIIFGYYFFFSGTQTKNETFQVKKAKIVEEVSVTGKVKAAESADMSFERSGTVSGIYTEVGNKVEKGDLLVVLSNADAQAQYRQTEAALKKESAHLAELLAGTRPEEISLQENTVSRAETSLREAVRSYIDSANDVYAKSDDAVRGKADLMFSNPRGSDPRLNFNADFTLKLDIESRRLNIEQLLIQGSDKLTTLSAESIYNTCLADSTCGLDVFFTNLLDQTSAFLEKMALAVNSLSANSNLSQTTIDTWKSNVSTARTSVNNSVISLSAASEKIKTAAATLKIEKDRLVLDKSGSTKETILGQQASEDQARANLSNAAAQLEKYFLRAPFSGLVTKQEAKIGQLVNPTDIVVSIISAGQFEMEAFVPEADIAKVALNNKAEVTLDAYGSDVAFPATVYSIDPAETVIDNVSTYKIKLRFDREDQRVKSGMTANINIITATKENVLILPMRAINNQDGEKTVSIIYSNDDTKTKDVKITTGLKGSTGYVEVTTGLNEGDKVIIPTR